MGRHIPRSIELGKGNPRLWDEVTSGTRLHSCRGNHQAAKWLVRAKQIARRGIPGPSLGLGHQHDYFGRGSAWVDELALPELASGDLDYCRKDLNRLKTDLILYTVLADLRNLPLDGGSWSALWRSPGRALSDSAVADAASRCPIEGDPDVSPRRCDEFVARHIGLSAGLLVEAMVDECLCDSSGIGGYLGKAELRRLIHRDIIFMRALRK